MPPSPSRIATAYLTGTTLHTAAVTKTAGEVIFRKDRGGDKGEWAWGGVPPSKRELIDGFEYKIKQAEPLAMTLRAALMALGHASSAQNIFVKIKSAEISPDGALGGRGYIQKIADIRRQFMNVTEALSALTDTLHDELKAPHWHPDAEHGGPRERDEVQQIMSDADQIQKDPEGWAEKQEQKSGTPTENNSISKTAARFLSQHEDK